MSRAPGTIVSDNGLPIRSFRTWATLVFTWFVLTEALLLALILVVLGESDAGPAGTALFAIAAVIVLAYVARLSFPLVWRAVKKIRLRFGLRTLLVATLLIGIGMALFGNRVRDASLRLVILRQQREIVDRVYGHGFAVGFNDSQPNWVYGRFGMTGALAWEDLEYVVNNSSKVDLEMLNGLRYRALSLNLSSVTDDQIARWNPPAELRFFEAQKTGLGDKAIEYLAACDGLEAVDLSQSLISDEGIRHLARLPQLKILGLQNTRITDGAIERLKTMKQLRQLKIWGTAITPQGAKELREALPQCVILDTWPPPPHKQWPDLR